MSSEVSEQDPPRTLRRSTRRLSVISAPTPRQPISRAKRKLERQAPVSALNGSKDANESGPEDEESPSKKLRPESEGAALGGFGDGTQQEHQTSAAAMETEEPQEMDVTPDESPAWTQHTHQLLISQDTPGDVKLSPHVALGERCRNRPAMRGDGDQMKTARGKSSSEETVALNKSATHIRPQVNSHDSVKLKPTSMVEYRRGMEAKPKSSDLPTTRYRLRGYLDSEKSYKTEQCGNNIPKPKVVQRKKQEVKKKTAKTSGRGFVWYLWRLVFLGLLGAAVFVTYKAVLAHRTTAQQQHPHAASDPGLFAEGLSLLESRFPSQRSELWSRSRIHLQRHLQSSQPTEPVSLILTAGLGAERTLRCLARGLASSFSLALNASVLHIDGAGRAGQDSDQVKLDIDGKLQAAFEGDQPVAVIHRLEELPPGSTLIFYRYCDHENAAYKRVFLLFTVLLGQEEEVGAARGLTEVDEMVQDYLKERLVGSGGQATFNAMDSDKFGGLWSRISHLVLPVVSEPEVELRGCS